VNSALPILLIALPLFMAALALAISDDSRRSLVVPAAGIVHLLLTVWALGSSDVSAFGRYLELDRLGRVVLLQTSVVYAVASLYVPGYLSYWRSESNKIFCAALCFFLATISLIILSHNLGLMWVALEMLTLASAPLVYFHRNPRSLEATWKYLVIGSVGIGLALLGSFFLAYSALAGGHQSTLLFDDLVRGAPQLSKPWLHTAFILLFVGYGTKMGLAPMHTWKPDAYGEAPGLVGIMLAGCATSCAFLAILRFYQICRAADDAGFARSIMVAIGLCSMVVAAAFMTRQKDYKRMLAYSSVEHMGILVLGIGVGGAAIFGSLLHLCANATTKGVLFLSAGNIHRAYKSKLAADVTGAMQRTPVSGAMLLLGFFAITGSPPFGMFFSEFSILKEAIVSGQTGVAAIFLLALVVVFMGMGSTVLSMVQGRPASSAPRSSFVERPGTVGPIILFGVIALALGVYIPRPIEELLQSASSFLEGGR
jgi:hydrogenase-4 component F